ncbi:MAG: murein biosynthesis integral membrane protein MurJ [Gammaproteobacteria bacterium]|nr:murein biosynthesis integral membrane protein MurJ [Gammaproteobacteria bacterium]
MSRALLKSTSVVGGFTLLSRVLGLVRDVVLSTYIPVGKGMDAFLVAFKIPNFMRRMFGEGAFSQAFVPVVGEYRKTREHQEVQALVDRVAGTFGGMLLLINALGIIAAPLLVLMFAPGFLDNNGQFLLTTELLRITFPYLFFIALTAFAGGILNTYGHFAGPALAPVLLNVLLIAAAIWGGTHFEVPVMPLAWAVLLAGIAQLLLQLPFLARIKLVPRPRWDRHHPGVRRVFRLMLPALFGSSVAQVNLLVDTLIASFLAVGSVTWLYFGDRLMEFPLGVFAIALGTVILPKLSEQHAARDPEQFRQTLDFALRLAFLVGVPAAVGLFVLAQPIIATLFFHVPDLADKTHNVIMTSWALMAYSLGLLGFTLVKILAPGYFARQDTRTPVRVGFVAVGVNVALNIAIVYWLVREGFAAPHAGLALATGVAAFVNAGLLYRGLRKHGHFTPLAGWWLFLGRVLAAAALMGGLVAYLAGGLDGWLAGNLWERAFRLLGIVAAGGISYVLVLLASGLRPRHFKGL